MRLSSSSPTLLSLLAVLLSSTHLSTAKPYPRDVPFGEVANALLEKRQCAYPCGYSGQLCCTAAGQCYTDSSGQAQCGSGGGSGAAGYSAPVVNNQASGQWAYYTTTYVETGFVTRVSTYSSYLGLQTLVAATSTHAPAVTNQALTCQSGNMPCGSICCASSQYCLSAGHCAAAAAGDVSASYYSSYLNTYASAATVAPIAPLRPTSGGPTTLTSTASATVPFQTPVGTAGGVVFGAGANVTAAAPAQNAGLSGGAIAGIVIGVLLALLLLVLACCFGGLRRLFGSRTKKVEETYIHESHHSGSGAPPRRQWFGTAGPARPAKKKSSGGGAGAVAAGLAGLAIALGLKRRHDRKKASVYGDSDSSYGSSYYDTSSSE